MVPFVGSRIFGRGTGLGEKNNKFRQKFFVNATVAGTSVITIYSFKKYLISAGYIAGTCAKCWSLKGRKLTFGAQLFEGVG